MKRIEGAEPGQAQQPAVQFLKDIVGSMGAIIATQDAATEALEAVDADLGRIVERLDKIGERIERIERFLKERGRG